MSIDWETADRELQRDLYLQMTTLTERIKEGHKVWGRHRKKHGRDDPRSREIQAALEKLEEDKRKVRRNFFAVRAKNEARAKRKRGIGVDANQYGF